MERIEFQFSGRERDEFNSLRPIPGEAWDFWDRVGAARNLDPRSIFPVLNKAWTFNALPAGHPYHFCWPSPLKCKHPPKAA